MNLEVILDNWWKIVALGSLGIGLFGAIFHSFDLVALWALGMTVVFIEGLMEDKNE